VRGLASLAGIGEDIVDGQDAPGHKVARPGNVIRECGRVRVSPVYEEHGQGRRPHTHRRGGRRHDGHHGVPETRLFHDPAEETEGVDLPFPLVEEVGIEVLLPGLLLFRSPVVIDGVEDAVVLTAAQAQVEGGPAAVAAYLEHGSPQACLPCEFIEPLALRGIQKALDGQGIDVVDLHVTPVRHLVLTKKYGTIDRQSREFIPQAWCPSSIALNGRNA